jgi:predicted nuclease with TOPRIM domain
MNEDITKELPMSDSEKLNQVLTISRNIIAGMNQMDARISVLEAKEVVTKPLWQEMRADQKRLLDILQEHSNILQEHRAKLEQIEGHLQQQDEKIAELDEKVGVGFRKLGDKFEHLALDYYDLHADARDLQRRVTRLEPVN